MNKLITICFFLATLFTSAQSAKKISNENDLAFKGGEWLKYRMSYSNFLNAGYSTIDVKEIKKNGKPAFHINGKGKSTGLVSVFFKVKDNYQTFISKETLKPYRFIRKINEGGYTKDKEIFFDHQKKEATVKNHKHNTEKKYPISSNIQDILSSMYFLRNQDLTNLKVGQEIELKMFFDQEINNFKLQFIGKEVIKTKFGKVSTLKFKPLVQAGRVFKEKESVTVWISNDKNKVPLKIKASLAVGSLRADLDKFKGLAHPFNIIFDN
ncbi:Protein of unknown function [Lutibacter oricola]|uniref:ATP-dependent exonuclease n=1 Tax=Lutibacter oricola TaxID=762486 RepID=A0A1H3G5L0_9FLAO|nr:DUF3108 domain-containing protein [Lutibacter oricola]SDX97639.1 Protein of unknown function [Lutibacter oricola]